MQGKRLFFIYIFFSLILVPVIIFRSLFSDELSYYLQAGKLVREGYLPYRDFFYPQMPFSAYIYALTSTGGFKGLYLSRIFACSLFFVLSILFFYKKKSLRLLLLFLLNGGFLIFYTIGDKDIIIGFFLSIIFLLSLEEKNLKNLFLSGLLIGILTGIRYIFILSLIFFIPLRRKELFPFISGFLISFSPIIFFVNKSPFYFFFDNFYYHIFLRKKCGFSQKIFQIFKTLSYPPNAIILFGMIMSSSKKFLKYYIFLITINFLYYIILSGTQFFYLTHTLPIMIYLGIDFFERMDKKLFLKIFLIYTISGIILDSIFYLPGLKEPQKSFNIINMRKVCEIVNKNKNEEDVVLSELSHITYLTNSKSVLNFRTFSSIHLFPFDEHIYSPYHLYLYIKKYKPQIIVIHRENLRYTGIKNNYFLIHTFSNYLIFKKSP